MKKKYIFIIFFILLIIIFFITYKFLKYGNNISKSDDNNILNISSYEAVVEVEVTSNKNKNKYVLRQQYIEPNIFKQEVLEPENIKGLETSFDGEKLQIKNKSLNLQMIYENYSCIEGNSLSLKAFIDEYKKDEAAEVKKNDNEIIIKIKTNNGNKYQEYKTLYVDKKTNFPTKMEILDYNKNRTIYILYREIRINAI